jgi:hypothetical protein
MSLDMFERNPLIGLRVKLDRPIDRDQPCCRNFCVIEPGRPPYAGALVCIDCGKRRGWLSQTTARWIASVAGRFVAPTRPIAVRKAHVFQEEVPPEKN